jgi:glucans biosynthesis protein
LFLISNAVAAFDFGSVMQRAGEMAARPFKAPDALAPEELRRLSIQQYRSIRFRPERALWHGARTPFEVTPVHQGMSFDRTVVLNEISSDGVRRLTFDPGAFDYGGLKLGALNDRALGFAGFRVAYRFDAKGGFEDVASFLGASYFRAVGEGLRTGLAARGLAVDTAEASGEEFPRFVEFWIERPAPGDRHLVVLALLDSRRATGAYRFLIRPGEITRIEVKARIFLRETVAKLGLGPLTSMYLYGENQPPASGMARPEVHDSDGLSIQSATGEWLWRPLVNPRRLLVTSFAQNGPVGFGLMQRDRDFRSYDDLDARFDLRPSAWVSLKGNWGPGRIELVQIPSPDETNDNIVAYWVPQTAMAPRKPIDLDYELLWGKASQLPLPPAYVVQTRRLPNAPSDRKDRPSERLLSFAVDFEASDPERSRDVTPVWTVSSADNAEILERTLRRHDATGGWRATVRLRQLDEKRPVELRGQLNVGNAPWSEVWSYVVPPE